MKLFLAGNVSQSNIKIQSYKDFSAILLMFRPLPKLVWLQKNDSLILNLFFHFQYLTPILKHHPEPIFRTQFDIPNIVYVIPKLMDTRCSCMSE